MCVCLTKVDIQVFPKMKWFSCWFKSKSAVNICHCLRDPDCMNEVNVFCFSLCSSSHLEKSLQMLMDRVDDMCQDISKYNNYSRSLSKQQQQKHQVAHPSASQSFPQPGCCLPQTQLRMFSLSENRASLFFSMLDLSSCFKLEEQVKLHLVYTRTETFLKAGHCSRYFCVLFFFPPSFLFCVILQKVLRYLFCIHLICLSLYY